MAGDLGVRRVEPALLEQAADFFERARDARRVARELDGGGVRQPFTLPADGAFDEPLKREAEGAEHDEKISQRRGRQYFDVVILDKNGIVRRRGFGAAVNQHAPEQGRPEKPMRQPDQFHVQPRVAV